VPRDIFISCFDTAPLAADADFIIHGLDAEFQTGINALASLVRSYFKMDGHHVQFNVVRAETLRQAQADPAAHRDLIVRVAGYSDYFCDLSRELQEEIIERTEHAEF